MIIRGDSRHLPLRDSSVDCVVTSPPYYGLRDYGMPEQIGLEASPDDYVATLVGVFRELRRVLKDCGTCWLNLGDSYTSMLRSGRDESPGVGATQALPAVRNAVKWGKGGGTNFWWRVPAFGSELKPKDLMGIPWPTREPRRRTPKRQEQKERVQWSQSSSQPERSLRSATCRLNSQRTPSLKRPTKTWHG